MLMSIATSFGNYLMSWIQFMYVIAVEMNLATFNSKKSNCHHKWYIQNEIQIGSASFVFAESFVLFPKFIAQTLCNTV